MKKLKNKWLNVGITMSMSAIMVGTSLGLSLTSNYDAGEMMTKQETRINTPSLSSFSQNDIASDFNDFAQKKFKKQLILNNNDFGTENYIPSANGTFNLNAQLKYEQHHYGLQWFSTNLTSTKTYNDRYFKPSTFFQLNLVNQQTSLDTNKNNLKNVIVQYLNEIYEEMFPNYLSNCDVVLPAPQKDSNDLSPTFSKTKGKIWRVDENSNKLDEEYKKIDQLFDDNPTTHGFEVIASSSTNNTNINNWSNDSDARFQKNNTSWIKNFNCYLPSIAWYMNPDYETVNFNSLINMNNWPSYQFHNSKFDLNSFKVGFGDNFKVNKDGKRKQNSLQDGGETHTQFRVYDNSYEQQSDWRNNYEIGESVNENTKGSNFGNLNSKTLKNINDVMNYGKANGESYPSSQEQAKMSRFDNIYLDLSNLIMIDNAIGGTSTINNGNAVWGLNNKNPQVKFGWNTELMWALKKKAMIAESLWKLISAISKSSADINIKRAWMKSSHTRLSVSYLLKDVYDEKVDESAIENCISSLKNGAFDYTPSWNEKKSTMEAQILKKYGWDLMENCNRSSILENIMSLKDGFDAKANSGLTNELNNILRWELAYNYIIPQVFKNDIWVKVKLKDDVEDIITEKIYDGQQRKWNPIVLSAKSQSNGKDDFNNHATVEISQIRLVRAGENGGDESGVAGKNSKINRTLSLENIFKTSLEVDNQRRNNVQAIATEYNSETRSGKKIVVSGSEITTPQEKLVFHFQFNNKLQYDDGLQLNPVGNQKALVAFSDDLYVSDYINDIISNNQLSEKYQQEIFDALKIPKQYAANKNDYINAAPSYKSLGDIPSHITSQVAKDKYQKYDNLLNDLVDISREIEATGGNPSEQQIRQYLQSWKALNDLQYFYTLVYTNRNTFPIDFYTRPEQYRQMINDGSIIELSENNELRKYGYGVQIAANAKTLAVSDLKKYVSWKNPLQMMSNSNELENQKQTLNNLKGQFSNLGVKVKEAINKIANLNQNYKRVQQQINEVILTLQNSYVNEEKKIEVRTRIQNLIDGMVNDIEAQRDFLEKVMGELDNLKQQTESVIARVEANANADYEATISLVVDLSAVYHDTRLLKAKTLDGLDDAANGNQLAYYFGLSYQEFCEIINQQIAKEYPGLNLELNKQAFKLNQYELEGVVGMEQTTPWNEFYSDETKSAVASWTIVQNPLHERMGMGNEISSAVLNIKVNEKINVMKRAGDFGVEKNNLINTYKNNYQILRSNAMSFKDSLMECYNNLNNQIVEIKDGVIVGDESAKADYALYQQVLQEFLQVQNNNSETLKLSRWKELNKLGYFYIPAEIKVKNKVGVSYQFALKIKNNFRVLELDDLERYLDLKAMKIQQKVVEEDKIKLYDSDAERYYKNLNAVQKQLVTLREKVDAVGKEQFNELQKSINQRIEALLAKNPVLENNVKAIVKKYETAIGESISKLESGFMKWKNTNEYHGSGFVQKMDMKFNFLDDITVLKSGLEEKMDELQGLLNADGEVVALKNEFAVDIQKFNDYIVRLLGDVKQLKSDMEVLAQDVDGLIQNLKTIINFEYNCTTTLKFDMGAIAANSRAYWWNKEFNFLSLANLNYLFGVSKNEFINKLNEIVKQRQNFDIKLDARIFDDQQNGVEIKQKHYGYLKEYQVDEKNNQELKSLAITIKYFDYTKVDDIEVSLKRAGEMTPDAIKKAAKYKIINSIEKCNTIQTNINGTIEYIGDVLVQGEKNRNIVNRLNQNFHPELQKIQQQLDEIETTNQTYREGFIRKEGSRLNPVIMAVTIIGGLVAIGLIAGLWIHFSSLKRRKTKQISEEEKRALDEFIIECNGVEGLEAGKYSLNRDDKKPQ